MQVVTGESPRTTENYDRTALVQSLETIQWADGRLEVRADGRTIWAGWSDDGEGDR